MGGDVRTDHAAFMQRAIELSREGMRHGEGGPFGAVVVLDGEIVGEGCNHVIELNDPTAHAEISAIRQACSHRGDFSLEGATIYTSSEPCPMCLAAIYWARIDRVYYANTASEAAAIGFDDAFLYDQFRLPSEHRELPCEHLPSAEARAVFAEWAANPDKVEY